MTTRRLLRLVVAVAFSSPPCAWAQQPARLPTVGILSIGEPTACGSGAPGFPAFCMVESLRALGHVEGRNIAFEYRFANGDFKRLPALAGELVALRPDVVYTFTGAGADAAAKATTTIPIVAAPAGETALSRLAGSLARPVGNLTGQTSAARELNQKCLQLLKELAPRASRVAVILSPDNPDLQSLDLIRPAAVQLGVTLVKIEARNVSDLPQAFAAVASSGADAIFMFDEAGKIQNVRLYMLRDEAAEIG